jgi:hypothetical protein
MRTKRWCVQGPFCQMFLVPISFVSKHPFSSPTCSNTWPSMNRVDFYLNSYCDSCAKIIKMKICASQLMFIGLHLLLVNMLVGLLYGFRDDLGVNTHFQLDLLVKYVNYYSMWSLRWKAMRLPMHVFIITMNLRAVISVINGQTWDKATTQSWSLNKYYLTHGCLYILIKCF